jgi:hypothetical protein
VSTVDDDILKQNICPRAQTVRGWRLKTCLKTVGANDFLVLRVVNSWSTAEVWALDHSWNQISKPNMKHFHHFVCTPIYVANSTQSVAAVERGCLKRAKMLTDLRMKGKYIAFIEWYQTSFLRRA